MQPFDETAGVTNGQTGMAGDHRSNTPKANAHHVVKLAEKPRSDTHDSTQAPANQSATWTPQSANPWGLFTGRDQLLLRTPIQLTGLRQRAEVKATLTPGKGGSLDRGVGESWQETACGDDSCLPLV